MFLIVFNCFYIVSIIYLFIHSLFIHSFILVSTVVKKCIQKRQQKDEKTPFICLVCGVVCSRLYNLQRHTLKYHNRQDGEMNESGDLIGETLAGRESDQIAEDLPTDGSG